MCNLQEEDLEAQVSFLQGQINDLEAMSKYCAKMMNTHICECMLKTSLCMKRVKNRSMKTKRLNFHVDNLVLLLQVSLEETLIFFFFYYLKATLKPQS